VEQIKGKARELIGRFKGDAYVFGLGTIGESGRLAGRFGRRFLLVRDEACLKNGMFDGLSRSFEGGGLKIAAECPGAGPNAPVEDVERVRDEILRVRPDAVVGMGGGSLIDGVKASVTLASLGGSCDDYYGAGKVSERIEAIGKPLMPFLIVQTASASGAHLTKYANVTNERTMQKKLFIDVAVVPPAALFDYRATITMPARFTKVGAFDGVCHLLETYFGVAEDHEQFGVLQEVALAGLELIIAALPGVLKEPDSEPLREALGLGTDLGGHAIMIGSTNGPHLNSFSLVDIMDHGQATALLMPYYTCFFGPAIRGKLTRVGAIYQRYGYVDADAALEGMSGEQLGRAVGRGMAAMAESVDFPTTLEQVEGFSDEHEARMLSAAKDPALASKLQGMPIPMQSHEVDRYMGSVLKAARTGDFSLIVPHDDVR